MVLARETLIEQLVSHLFMIYILSIGYVFMIRAMAINLIFTQHRILWANFNTLNSSIALKFNVKFRAFSASNLTTKAAWKIVYFYHDTVS